MFEIQAEINKHTKKQKNVSNHQRANQKKKKNQSDRDNGTITQVS